MGKIEIEIVTEVTSVDEEVSEQITETHEKAYSLVNDHLKDIIISIGREDAYRNREIAYALMALAYGILQDGEGKRPDDTFAALSWFAKQWVENKWHLKTVN